MTKTRITLMAAAAATALTAASQGQVNWLETEHDFGTFPESVGKVTGVMKFVNTGDSALSITRVRPTCGCTTSEFSSTTVAPGDTASISITYSAVGHPGQFKKDVYVYTTGEPHRSVVAVKGKVIGSASTVSEQYPVAVDELRLERASVPLGDITRGKTRMAYVGMYNTSLDSMVVTFGATATGIIPQALPDTVAPGSSATVTVFLDSSDAPLWGLNTYPFTIVATPLHGTTASGSAEVSVMAVVRENFDRLTPKERAEAPVASLEANKADFATINRNGNPITRQLRLTNTGRNPLLLRRIYTLAPGIEATAPVQKLKSGKSTIITVTVDPQKLDPDDTMLNARINVITNDPANPVQMIRAVGLLQK